MADDQNKTEDKADPSADAQDKAPEVQEENSDVQEQSTADDSQQPTDASNVIPSGSEESPDLEAKPGDPSPTVQDDTEGEAEQAEEAHTEEEAADLGEAEEAQDAQSDSTSQAPLNDKEDSNAEKEAESGDPSSLAPQDDTEKAEDEEDKAPENPNAVNGKWYVVHTFAGHENRVSTTLKQRIEAEHLENLIFDILVPTQDKIEIRGGKKETVKEKIFPGYILVKMILSDESWLAVRTTQGVTSFVGAGNKPTPISEAEVNTIVKFTTQGAQPTFKDVFMVDDTVKIIDGPFSEFIGKVDSVDKEKGRVRVLVSIFGRETPVELDFLQVQKL